MSHAGVTANVAIFKIATSISTIRANFEMGRKSDSSVSVIGALGGSGHLFFNWDLHGIVDEYFGLSSWKPQ